ncbi:hypothetical protein Ddc_15448 [Ditylenchus destructor]|nr:hypothetical protein Ddc_15448 [Ditylenchus destructor]
MENTDGETSPSLESIDFRKDCIPRSPFCLKFATISPMMYLILIFTLILLDADGITSSDNFNSTLPLDAVKQDMTRQKHLDNLKIFKAIALHNASKTTHWEHNEQCRITLAHREESTCKSPNLNEDFCFGTAIKYNYTTGPNMETFPQQFEILSRFPRCWSQLSPLLCARQYRPCKLRTLTVKAKGHNAKETLMSSNKFELWEVLPKTFCTRAKEECGFLVKMNLWPKFLDCEDTIESSKLGKPGNTATEDLKPYNDKCEVNYREAPIKPKMRQCMWPLVGKSSNDVIINAQPLIDDCYLPCRSPLYDDQSSMYFLAALGLALCFVTWAFLVWFSKIYEDHFSVFLLSNALFSGLVYYAMISLPYFDAVFERTVCTDGGRIRLSPPIIDLSKAGGALSLCTLSSWLITVSFISMNAWVAAFLIHRILGTDSQDRDYELPIKTVKGGGNPRIDPRRFHQMIIYLFASLYSTFFSFLIDIPTDGQLGICHYAVGDITRIFIVYGPVYAMAFIVLVTLMGRQIWSNWKYHNRSNPNLLRRGSKGSKGFEETIVLPSRTDHEKPLICDGENPGRMETDKKLTTETGIMDKSCEDGNVVCQDANNLTQNVFPSGFFRYMAAAYFLSIFLSGVSQYSLYCDKKQEGEAILDSIRCSLKFTLLPDDSWMLESWKNDGLATRAVPYRRESLIHSNLFPPGCDLEPGPGSGYLFLYIFFYPALPILVVILWFFIGCFFRTEYTEQLFVIRKNIIPCTRDQTKDRFDLESSHGSTPTVQNEPSVPIEPTESHNYHRWINLSRYRPSRYNIAPILWHYRHEPKQEERNNESIQTAQETSQLLEQRIPDTPPEINTAPSAPSSTPPVQNPSIQQNPHLSYNAPAGWAADAMSINSMQQAFHMPLASGPTRGLDPNQILNMVHAAGLRLGEQRGAMMTEQKWEERFNQISQHIQIIAEELKERKEKKKANVRPTTPSSSSDEGEQADNEECDDDAEDVEDSEASSTRYSDIYKSDEPGSGEERYFNEQLKTMRLQNEAKSGQLSNSAGQCSGTNAAGPSTR